MQTSQDHKLRYEIEFFNLPLAVYREIAAHLRQVEGVETGLHPASHQHFDYNQSQIGSLWIEYTPNATHESRDRVAQILAYYQKCHGAFQEIEKQA